jgi:CRP-like cAMP-binding protein
MARQAADMDRADPRRNSILRALPERELGIVLERCEPVEADLKEVVYERGKPITHVQFPLASIFSFVALIEDEIVVEVGTIGPEGMVGLPVFLGVPQSPNAAFCQIPGPSLRMSVEDLREVLLLDGALHDRLALYTQAMILQLAQNVACNRMHTAEERAARWLLMTADRVGSLEFPLTQEFLAQMLGVRRPTVSLTAGILQSAGLIRYARGRIAITDPDGLRAASCDCYRLLRDEFDRLTQP